MYINIKSIDFVFVSSVFGQCGIFAFHFIDISEAHNSKLSLHVRIGVLSLLIEAYSLLDKTLPKKTTLIVC